MFADDDTLRAQARRVAEEPPAHLLTEETRRAFLGKIEETPWYRLNIRTNPNLTMETLADLEGRLELTCQTYVGYQWLDAGI